MLAAQSPISGTPIHRPKSGRTPLQPKNSSATPVNTTTNPTKPPTKTTPKWIEISLVDNDSNKENIHPIFNNYATPEKTSTIAHDPLKIESFDLSLADELSAIREKLERLRIDKEKTEKMLEERDLMLDMQIKELRRRGQVQKQLENEVDRLYRLKELRSSCMRVSPIRSLREKERAKIINQDQSKEMKEEDRTETMGEGNPGQSSGSQCDHSKK